MLTIKNKLFPRTAQCFKAATISMASFIFDPLNEALLIIEISLRCPLYGIKVACRIQTFIINSPLHVY
jgi:hypothetical protein